MVSALEEAGLLAVNFKLGVLCYAAKEIPVMYAVSKLIIPGLVDQLNSMKNVILPNLLTKHPQVRQPIRRMKFYGSSCCSLCCNPNFTFINIHILVAPHGSFASDSPSPIFRCQFFW